MKNRIENLFIMPLFDAAQARVRFTAPETGRVQRWVLHDANAPIAEGECDIGPSQEADFPIDMPGFTPWSVETPYLYTLVLHGEENGGAFEQRQRFGMTRIHVENRRIHFNNRPLFLRGHIRGREAHDHPNLLGGSHAEYYEKNLRMSKAYGFNLIRFHSRVPDETFLDLADEIGMLLQVEIRKYYGKYQKERKSTGFDGDQTLVDEADWEAMLLRLRNHPSVLVYCMGNEINHPGLNERVHIIRNLTRKLDPTRLFLDTCSRGEYDRETVDLDVQHLSYFAPFGRNYNMFSDSIHLNIYGSIEDKPMWVESEEANAPYAFRREIPVRRPLLAHEVCHYISLRDPYALDEKFARTGSPKPWWVDELKAMIEAKGHTENYEQLRRASAHFQYIWIKQCLESVRRSPILQGFHMLQMADTEKYENANGLLDCFDDPKDIAPERILPINGPTVLVADLPRRSFHAGERITVPIHISHFPTSDFSRGDLAFRLTGADGKTVLAEDSLGAMDLDRHGNYPLARLEITLPAMAKAQPVSLALTLTGQTPEEHVENAWDLWVFPNQPNRIPEMAVTTSLRDIQLQRRYPHLTCRTDLKQPERLLIADRFTPDVLDHLAAGDDVLLLYRIEENRSRKAKRESLYLPSTWERFKAIIWDRGHNCGGFLRPHPVTEEFPNGGFIDWQFHALIEDSDKVDLDDFPIPLEPIIEGVDKAVRDRFDVNRIGFPEFQYAYTLRKFAYLFELRAGPGRLLVAPLNFTGIERDEPAVCWMFEALVRHMLSDRFEPAAAMEVEALRDYLRTKGEAPRIKERMMTQYWQLDDAPLETKEYWAESEAWIREDPRGETHSHWGTTPWLEPTSYAANRVNGMKAGKTYRACGQTSAWTARK